MTINYLKKKGFILSDEWEDEDSKYEVYSIKIIDNLYVRITFAYDNVDSNWEITSDILYEISKIDEDIELSDEEFNYIYYKLL